MTSMVLRISKGHTFCLISRTILRISKAHTFCLISRTKRDDSTQHHAPVGFTTTAFSPVSFSLYLASPLRRPSTHTPSTPHRPPSRGTSLEGFLQAVATRGKGCGCHIKAHTVDNHVINPYQAGGTSCSRNLKCAQLRYLELVDGP